MHWTTAATTGNESGQLCRPPQPRHHLLPNRALRSLKSHQQKSVTRHRVVEEPAELSPALAVLLLLGLARELSQPGHHGLSGAVAREADAVGKHGSTTHHEAAYPRAGAAAIAKPVVEHTLRHEVQAVTLQTPVQASIHRARKSVDAGKSVSVCAGLVRRLQAVH